MDVFLNSIVSLYEDMPVLSRSENTSLACGVGSIHHKKSISTSHSDIQRTVEPTLNGNSLMVDLNKCIAGDKQAWDDFVDSHAAGIYSTALRVFRNKAPCPDPADVMDVTQNVFMRLVQNNYKLLRQFDPGRASLKTWLVVITRSTALDFFKNGFYGARLQLIEDDVEGIASNDPPWPHGVDIPPGLLTARQELIIRLLYDENCGTDDVASILGIHRQTVRSMKHQALERLRNHFSTECA